MDRRQFLQWSWQVGVAAAGLGGIAAAVVRPSCLVPVGTPAVVPGALVQVQVARHAPSGATLHWLVHHGGHVHDVPAQQPGAPLRLDGKADALLQTVVPYPYDDLVPGPYTLELVLRDSGGRELERCSLGGFSLRRQRFSA